MEILDRGKTALEGLPARALNWIVLGVLFLEQPTPQPVNQQPAGKVIRRCDIVRLFRVPGSHAAMHCCWPLTMQHCVVPWKDGVERARVDRLIAAGPQLQLQEHPCGRWKGSKKAGARGEHVCCAVLLLSQESPSRWLFPVCLVIDCNSALGRLRPGSE